MVGINFRFFVVVGFLWLPIATISGQMDDRSLMVEFYSSIRHRAVYRERNLESTCLLNAGKFGDRICLVDMLDPEEPDYPSCRAIEELHRMVVSKRKVSASLAVEIASTTSFVDDVTISTVTATLQTLLTVSTTTVGPRLTAVAPTVHLPTTIDRPAHVTALHSIGTSSQNHTVSVGPRPTAVAPTVHLPATIDRPAHVTALHSIGTSSQNHTVSVGPRPTAVAQTGDSASYSIGITRQNYTFSVGSRPTETAQKNHLLTAIDNPAIVREYPDVPSAMRLEISQRSVESLQNESFRDDRNIYDVLQAWLSNPDALWLLMGIVGFAIVIAALDRKCRKKLQKLWNIMPVWCAKFCCQSCLLALQKCFGYNNRVDPVANPRFYADRIMLAVDDVSRADPSFDLEAMLHLNEPSYVSSFADSSVANVRPHLQHSVMISLRNILTEKVQNRSLVHNNPPNVSTPHTQGPRPRPSIFGNLTHISHNRPSTCWKRPGATNVTENVPLSTFSNIPSGNCTETSTLSSTISQPCQVAIDEGTSSVRFVNDSANMAPFVNPLAKKSNPFENQDWTA